MCWCILLLLYDIKDDDDELDDNELKEELSEELDEEEFDDISELELEPVECIVLISSSTSPTFWS